MSRNIFTVAFFCFAMYMLAIVDASKLELRTGSTPTTTSNYVSAGASCTPGNVALAVACEIQVASGAGVIHLQRQHLHDSAGFCIFTSGTNPMPPGVPVYAKVMCASSALTTADGCALELRTGSTPSTTSNYVSAGASCSPGYVALAVACEIQVASGAGVINLQRQHLHDSAGFCIFTSGTNPMPPGVLVYAKVMCASSACR